MARVARTALSADFKSTELSSYQANEKNDCSVKAISIACGVSYEEALFALKRFGRKDRSGTPTAISIKAIEFFGFKIRVWSAKERIDVIKSYPGTHANLKSITTHHPRRFPRAWANCHPNMIWLTRDHMLAVKDGTVRDWSVNSARRVVMIWEIEKGE